MAPLPKPAGQRRRRNKAPAVVKLTVAPVAKASDRPAAARPTGLMERVSRYLEQQDAPASRRHVTDGVCGKATAIRAALDVLLAEHYISEQAGVGRARLVVSIRAYREANDEDAPGASHASRGGPVVPELPGAEKASPAMLLWWARVWSSPMAARWQPTDVYPLARLARLVDLEARGEATAAHLSAMTQLEASFGLSPLALRRLQWEIDPAGTEAEAPAAPAAAGESDARYLRLVGE